jgi:hypothetical protein
MATREHTAMRLILWMADKGFERIIGPGLIQGIERHRDTVEVRHLDSYQEPIGDGGIVFGTVKTKIIHDYRDAGRVGLYLDKSFVRTREFMGFHDVPGWWRVCINDTSPVQYLDRLDCPGDRWRALHWPLKPRFSFGHKILIAGGSAKYHEAHGLPDPTTWATRLVADLSRLTSRQIVYRPKPSWRAAKPVWGTTFDFTAKRSFQAALAEAWCVITHGSLSAVEAVIQGTPAIVLGGSPARPVASTKLRDVEAPFWPSDAERLRWASRLAYTQFTPRELTSGLAWEIVRRQIDIARAPA